MFSRLSSVVCHPLTIITTPKIKNPIAENTLRLSYVPSRNTFPNNMSDTIVKKAPITKARLFNLLYIAADLEE